MTIPTTYEIVNEDELADAFLGTNFGTNDMRDLRDILHEAVWQKACGYHCGHTITVIMQELGLIGTSGYLLPTVKGRKLMQAMWQDMKPLMRQIKEKK